MVGGGFDIGDGFVLVAEHDEHADFDTASLEHFGLLLDVDGICFAVHGVEDALGAGFGAEPETVTAHLGEEVDCLFIETVGAADTFEGDFDVASGQFGGVRFEPAFIDGKDVISVP